MHRARQHAETRARERRHRLAHEAARLMAEGGIRDFQQAKRKAASRLGIHDDASLPRNQEIEEALREYQRLFSGTEQLDALRARRQAAGRALDFFAAFAPRLVGPVLDGTADEHSAVMLHLHTDDPASVAHFMDTHGIPAENRMRRLRLDRQRTGDFDVWMFSADGQAFDVTVMPEACLRQAPLSALEDKPMQRASRAQLERMIALEQES